MTHRGFPLHELLDPASCPAFDSRITFKLRNTHTRRKERGEHANPDAVRRRNDVARERRDEAAINCDSNEGRNELEPFDSVRHSDHRSRASVNRGSS